MWKRLLPFALMAVIFGSFQIAEARSAFSPRHSGMDAPGGPRQLDNMPTQGIGRTPEGGMGYTDAYGRSLTDKIPEERKRGPRLRPGGYRHKDAPAELPDLKPGTGAPVWSFK